MSERDRRALRTRRTRPLLVLVLVVVALPLTSPSALAAAGCSLDDPERDLRRFFPSLTDFVTEVSSFDVQAPARHAELGRRLGSPLDAVYETPDVPYSHYTVIERGRTIGHVFGANQRGQFSNIQVIAVTGPDFALRHVYLQKLRSPAWKRFKDPMFLSALARVPLGDFPGLADCYTHERCDDVPVPDPTGGEHAEDHRAILRGLAKLHLVRELLLAPPTPIPPRDDSARAQRVGQWWDGEETPTTLHATAWRADGQWPPDTPALLLPHPTTPRVWPLPLLQRHPVIVGGTDGAGGVLIATWSAPSGTAVLLRASSDAATDALVPTDSAVAGVGCIADRKTGTVYLPIDPRPLRGDGSGPTLERVGGVLLTTWQRAMTLAPAALSPATDDRAALLTAWGVSRARYGDAVSEPVIGIGGRLVHPQAARGALQTLRVSADELVAFERASPLRVLARDPWTGRPWVWHADSGELLDGITGTSLARGAAVMEPLPMFRLPRASLAPLGVEVSP